MTVFVTLLARLKSYAAGKIGENGVVTLTDGATVQELLAYLAIPERRGTDVVLVNGTRRDEQHRLKAEDDVKVLRMAGGG